MPDPQLNDALYKMLNGAPYKYKNEDKKKSENEPVESNKEDTSQDHEQIKSEAEEYKSAPGYYSLLDFITLKPPPKIRLYLAPKELLQAIFHDQNVVNEILIERVELHRQALPGCQPD